MTSGCPDPWPENKVVDVEPIIEDTKPKPSVKKKIVK
jgi:hypothetical protein